MHMRHTLVALMLACGAIGSAPAQVSVGVGVNLPGLSIGINIPSYPQLVRVPSYPVYYAPGVNANFFFYDGLYWVYEGDNWYESSWYNGPWVRVEPAYVPLYVLRVPVRYYRSPPSYFSGWRPDAPPRWGDHWGGDWSRRHSGWDRWNRSAAPAPAPLPVYQRQYAGSRYPPVAQQRALQSQNYRYQPHDAVVRERVQQTQTERPARAVPPPPRGHDNTVQRPAAPAERPPHGRAAPAEVPQAVPHATAPQAPPHAAPARPEPHAARPVPNQPVPTAQPPHESPGRGQGQGHGQGQEKDRGEGRGQDKKN